MIFQKVLDEIKSQGHPKDYSDESIEEWHVGEEVLKFLLGSIIDEDVPMYISETSLFLYSLIVPLRNLKDNYIDDLMKWNFSPSEGYGFDYTLSEGTLEPYLCEPMNDTYTSTLEGSDPVFFLRIFDGGNESIPVELNQIMGHVLGLHHMPKRNAWCCLNELGEIIDVARYEDKDNMICCTLKKDYLDKLLFIMKGCLIRVFDVTRSLDWDDSPPKTTHNYKNEQYELYAKRSIYRGEDGKAHTSLLRGFQIVRCEKSKEEMSLILQGLEPRKYESFIIQDWKNHRVIEWSSDPEKLGNYFVKSDLPFETSPAFFKPEVLTQYRQNPSRYIIDDRHITCKGAWSLRFDINAPGQVSAYIVDLCHLPHQEQLRWKAFNEPPKDGISERAFKNDFEGVWYDHPDPLRSLKDILRNFPDCDSSNRDCHVWKMPDSPDTRDINFLGYVLTESRKEWEDQVLALSQILVEGLNKKYINKISKIMNCLDPKLGSIKQLSAVLRTKEITEEEISIIIGPLEDLNKLRSSIVAHVGGSLPDSDLKNHYRDLLERCDKAMRELAELIKSGKITN